ncbi:MAG: tetratricopeptide repeat protein, partial [Cypionkella sp.]
ILLQLANLKLSKQDFTSVNEIQTALQQIATSEADAAANALQAAILVAQNRTEESLTFLQGQINQAAGGDNRALALMLETQVRGGKIAEARTILDAAIAKAPADKQLQMMNASLYAMSGDTSKAEEALRALITRDAAEEAPVRLLYSLLIGIGRPDEANSLLDSALDANPDSSALRFMKAGVLERAGDIDGAIVIYEALYAQDSGSVVIANNLASLITTYRNDPESLERAFAIARRLRGSDVPALQDTYGWIQYRRGNLDEAVTYLEPAAKGLTDDPLTQFHLGMTYAGLNRVEEARTTLSRALEIAGDSKLPQFQTAREALAKLGAAHKP